MALSDAELAYIRSEVGPTIPEDDLSDRYDRVGSARDVALEIVRERLGALLQDGPSAYNVTGVYSEDNTATIRGLQNQITRIQESRVDEEDGSALSGGLSEVVRTRLVRRRQR